MRPIPPIVAQNRSGSDASVIDLATLAVGQQHPHLADVVAERAVDVVALAVDVAGDRPADRDEPRPGVTGTNQPAGTITPQQVVEADAGVDRDRSGVVVEPDRRRRRAASRTTCRRRSAPDRRTSGRGRGRCRPAGRSATAARRRRRARRPDVDQRRHARRGAAPAGERRCVGLHGLPRLQIRADASVRPLRHRAAEPAEHLAEAQLSASTLSATFLTNHGSCASWRPALRRARPPTSRGRRGRSSATASARRTGTGARTPARAGSPA